MLENPTVEQVRELLVRAVEEKGADYVASACVYREPDGSPSCIVGHVLTYAGVPLTERIEGNAAHLVAPQSWAPRIRFALSEAQYTQDSGKPWGQALAAFDAQLGLVQA